VCHIGGVAQCNAKRAWESIVMAVKRLCSLVRKGFQKDQPEEYKGLLRDAKYMCKKCGRAAAKAKCLCKPTKI